MEPVPGPPALGALAATGPPSPASSRAIPPVHCAHFSAFDEDASPVG